MHEDANHTLIWPRLLVSEIARDLLTSIASHTPHVIISIKAILYICRANRPIYFRRCGVRTFTETDMRLRCQGTLFSLPETTGTAAAKLRRLLAFLDKKCIIHCTKWRTHGLAGNSRETVLVAVTAEKGRRVARVCSLTGVSCVPLQTQKGAELRRFRAPVGVRSLILGLNGGAGGIRTLDTLLTYTHFPGERLRPLGHRSALLWKGIC